MRCDEVEAVMMRFVDDRLDEPEAAAVDAHLDVCRRCRKLYAGEVEMVGVFAPLVERESAESLLPEVMAQVRAPQQTSQRNGLIPGRKVVGVCGGMGVAAAMALTTWVVFPPEPPDADDVRMWGDGLSRAASMSWLGWERWGLWTLDWTSMGSMMDVSDGAWLVATAVAAGACLVLAVGMRAKLVKELKS